MAEPDARFWRDLPVAVTGGEGFVGSRLVPMLERAGAGVSVIRSDEYDLRDPDAARAALDGAQIVVHLAARVGGIGFNRDNPALLVHDNMLLGCNVFEQARLAEVGRLVAACTVCAYPKHTPVPFQESELWAGYPEETNAPYGLAKKMMVVLSDAYRRQYGLDSCVPLMVNLYGPGDDFDLEESHVIPALIRRFTEARERGDQAVMLWGTGNASREFLHVDDAARALILCAERLEGSEPINIGSGVETSISDLARMIARLTGYEGEIEWDSSKPDGQPERRLDVSRARELLDFEPQVELEDGLRRTIEWFASNRPAASSAALRD